MEQLEPRGLSVEASMQLFSSEAFGSTVQKLGQFTLRQGLEGGFAVYHNRHTDQPPRISRLITPSYASLQRLGNKLPVAAVTDIVNMDTGKGNIFDGLQLIHTRTEQIRRDLAVTVHSHPSGMLYLRPSVPDLLLDYDNNLVNPGLICGIVAVNAERGSAALLAYRYSDIREPQPGYLHMLDSNSSTPSTLDAMNKAGLNSIQLDYNLESGSLQTDVGVVSTLYQ